MSPSEVFTVMEETLGLVTFKTSRGFLTFYYYLTSTFLSCFGSTVELVKFVTFLFCSLASSFSAGSFSSFSFLPSDSGLLKAIVLFFSLPLTIVMGAELGLLTVI
jgi:hypothetical protein